MTWNQVSNRITSKKNILIKLVIIILLNLVLNKYVSKKKK